MKEEGEKLPHWAKRLKRELKREEVDYWLERFPKALPKKEWERYLREMSPKRPEKQLEHWLRWHRFFLEVFKNQRNFSHEGESFAFDSFSLLWVQREKRREKSQAFATSE